MLLLSGIVFGENITRGMKSVENVAVRAICTIYEFRWVQVIIWFRLLKCGNTEEC